jgi:hypothetical protein
MIVTVLLTAAAIYCLLGLVFAIPFVIKGVNSIDESAAHGSAGFRIIIIPGVMVFWPVLLKKWLRVTSTKK